MMCHCIFTLCIAIYEYATFSLDFGSSEVNWALQISWYLILRSIFFYSQFAMLNVKMKCENSLRKNPINRSIWISMNLKTFFQIDLVIIISTFVDFKNEMDTFSLWINDICFFWKSNEIPLSLTIYRCVHQMCNSIECICRKIKINVDRNNYIDFQC